MIFTSLKYFRSRHVLSSKLKDILRFATSLPGEPSMKIKRKKGKKIDLLKMSEAERFKLLREAREKLRKRIVEEKLMRFLVNSEALYINGKIVYKSDEPLQGLSLDDAW